MVHFFRILYNILYVFAFLKKNANKNHNKSHSTHLLEWLKYKNKTYPLPGKKKKKPNWQYQRPMKCVATD